MICAVAMAAALLAALLYARRMRGLEGRLGRVCVVTFGSRTYLARCVAVSHRGAVAVSGMTIATRETVWVPKEDVARCVRWCDD